MYLLKFSEAHAQVTPLAAAAALARKMFPMIFFLHIRIRLLGLLWMMLETYTNLSMYMYMCSLSYCMAANVFVQSHPLSID